MSIADNFARMVATPPAPVVPPSRVGARNPSTPGDLPAMVISLTTDDQRTTGLARVMRSDELIARTGAIVQVSVTPDTFLSDLRHFGQFHFRDAPEPKDPGHVAITRIVMGPSAREALVQMLGQGIEQYEQKRGRIDF